MKQQTDTPLFETNLAWLDKAFVITEIVIGTSGLVYSLLEFAGDEWGGTLFICLLFIALIIQGLTLGRTFHLFKEKLIVRRPFFFPAKTEQVFKVDELKEVIFRRIKGRFGGPHLIIRSKRLNADFRIGFRTHIRNEFINHLTNLGVKVSYEDW